MACLLKFGRYRPPPTRAPTREELATIRRALDAYQEVFDNH